ncbi:unnamed protein product [Penicillium camemberti]|uniref:Str. FM013 n=1 Tax=Penicillium camemberti (strain FM 013) TaxID=1429867 RepID=A0A0G4P793_PENC3|nr:unnamed protein product [Penicillium camemberti]
MDINKPEDRKSFNQLHHILQSGVHTLNTERLPIYLEAPTNVKPTNVKPTNVNAPHLGDIQQDLLRLRQELAWHQEAKEALLGLFGDTREVYRLLQKALLKASVQHSGDNCFSELVNDAQHAGFLLRQCLQRASYRLSESESHLLEALGISLDDTNGRDITVL